MKIRYMFDSPWQCDIAKKFFHQFAAERQIPEQRRDLYLVLVEHEAIVKEVLAIKDFTWG